MSCESVQELISSYFDRQLAAPESENVLAHARSCRECGALLEYEQSVRSAMRKMSEIQVPAQLTTRLRVAASKERQRREYVGVMPTWMHPWSTRARLFFENLMRPMALPFAGGLLSALAIFSTLVPTLSTFQHASADQLMFTYPDGELVESTPSGAYQPGDRNVQLSEVTRLVRPDAANPIGANVVELTIDENGKVSDWALRHGQLTPDLYNIIMFGQFTPATSFGVPTSSKVKAVSFRVVESASIRVRS